VISRRLSISISVSIVLGELIFPRHSLAICDSVIARELRNEIAIRENQSVVEGGHFFQGRSLFTGRTSYSRVLGVGSSRFLSTLGPQDRWLDIGSGPGAIAQQDYFRDRNFGKNGKAQLAAVNVAPQTFATAEQKAAYEEFQKASGHEFHADGRTIEQYGSDEIKLSRLVTDTVAAVAYSPELPRVLEHEGQSVAPGGRLYSALFDKWGGRPATTIVDQYGKTVNPVDYLKAVQGMKLVEQNKEQVDSGISGIQFALERTDGPVKAPDLELVSFKNMTNSSGGREIPQITYRWIR
jgi:SAM-dependent methyltransferase